MPSWPLLVREPSKVSVTEQFSESGIGRGLRRRN
jgi:hypothetical protein